MGKPLENLAKKVLNKVLDKISTIKINNSTSHIIKIKINFPEYRLPPLFDIQSLNFDFLVHVYQRPCRRSIDHH